MTRVQEQRETEVDAPGRQLGLLRELFQRLHAEGLQYCHWKSNEHLGPSMRGVTDLDLLVHRSAALPLARLLAELGFKRFAVKAGAGYPGVEDYLGFDRDTGALSHLHIHYQLTLGAKFVKGHRLPWEEAVLRARRWDPRHGIYTATPEHELVLLIVRAALKLRIRDLAIAAANRPIIRGDTLREMRWLAERVDPEELCRVATSLIGTRAAAMLEVIRTRSTSLAQLKAFSRAINPPLRSFRLYSPLRAGIRAALREMSTVCTVLARKYRSGGIPVYWSTRTPPQGGVAVEIIGVSGSGKTRLTRLVAEWLSKEVAVFPVTGLGATDSVRQQARRARDLGMVVLSDGPLAAPDANPSSGGSGPALVPDLVLRLDLPVEAARARASSTRIELLRRQLLELDERTYAARTRLVTIDAQQPLPAVLLQVKHAIWEEL